MKTALTLSWLCTAVFLTACGEKPQQDMVSSAIKPEQTVQFAKGFACVTKTSYDQMRVQQSGNGEKASAPVAAMPSDCVALPPKTDFRVLSVEQHNGHALIQVSNVHNAGNSGGIWTTPEFVAPAP